MKQHDQVVRQPEGQAHPADPGSSQRHDAGPVLSLRHRGWGVLALVVAGVLVGWLVIQPRLQGTAVELGGQTQSASGAQQGVAVGWQRLPRAPLSPRWGSFAAWTGTEFIVWGGYANVGTPQEATADDGAAFNPDTGRWRQLAGAPIEAAYGGTAVWTGREVWVLGGIGEPYGRAAKRSAAAYEPSTDTWRALPDLPAPISSAAWSQQTDQVVVAGVGQRSDVRAWTLEVDGDRWVALPALPALQVDPEPDGAVSVAAGAGRGFLAVRNTVLTLDLERPGQWTGLADIPMLDGTVLGTLVAWTPDGLLVSTPEDAALYEPGAQMWHRLPRPPPMEGAQYALRATAGGYPVAVDEPTANLAVFRSRRRGWVALPDAPTRLGTRAAVAAGMHRGALVVFAWGGSDHRNLPLGNGAAFRAAR